jgi:hypothetical protein
MPVHINGALGKITRPIQNIGQMSNFSQLIGRRTRALYVKSHSSLRAFKQRTPAGVCAHLGDAGQLSILLAMPIGFVLHGLGVRGEPFEHTAPGIDFRGWWRRFACGKHQRNRNDDDGSDGHDASARGLSGRRCAVSKEGSSSARFCQLSADLEVWTLVDKDRLRPRACVSRDEL